MEPIKNALDHAMRLNDDKTDQQLLAPSAKAVTLLCWTSLLEGGINQISLDGL